MQTTGNLGLKKPEGTDIVDITDLNGNMDILDSSVNGKVDKIAGKQLSTNDYTTAEKTKLTGIAPGANNYTHPNHIGDVTSAGDGVTAIAAGVIVDADVNAAAGIAATKIGTGVVSNAEFGYLDGVTSGIQAQLAARPLLITTPQQTTAALTYYVRTDGNDSNTGLANTAGGAFKTIGKVIGMIPQIVNHAVIINISAGTYNENVLISGIIGGGYIDFVGTNVIVLSFQAMRCNRIIVRNITATSTISSGFAAYDGGFISILSCSCVATSTNAIGFDIQAQRADISTSVASNRSIGIYGVDANIQLTNNSGTGNTSGIVGGLGAVFTKSGTQPTGTTPEAVYAAIITNGVINPWGDNTQNSRPASRAYASGTVSQALSTAVWTKVQFPQENMDMLGNYDPSLHRFTALQAGIYQINATVTFLNPTANAACESYLYINGGGYRRLAYSPASSVSKSIAVSGSASVFLYKGDIVEIYAVCESACNLSQGVDSNFEIVRIA
ncbi:hypothetical protein H1230_04730 [Paenibacillus sp. 19GGS1-52]|uniref:hypothetical protein n=1 Tax=Paenibacillus sp. 19GGS1-52 TaxID=2758563 RepID=UPI001EFB5A4B|nr:hypothetical protein [Paenibacillus sp. 19GGS1-52]ULO08149.1 hypothetical protein H1230_04730 [Paenibacillus sp. 19GGS1-52]